MSQFNIDEIEKRTLSGLKDFQRATVERVDYLFRHNQNRVLVADEVGMGKTLIARGAIVKTARLRIEEKDELFKVIYICSNQNIANQNIRKLDVTGKNAIGSVSDTRLSMPASAAAPPHRQQGCILLPNSLTPCAKRVSASDSSPSMSVSEHSDPSRRRMSRITICTPSIICCRRLRRNS